MQDAPLSAEPGSFRFSVVIPTYRRRDIVIACVRALSRQENAPPFEVVVVVDGSNDESAERLRELATPFPLTVVEQANQGPAAARNRGSAVAQGEVLLFLDDDMEAHPRLLYEHERFHQAGFDVVFGDIPLHRDSRPGFLSAAVGAWAEGRSRALADRQGVALHDLITGQMSLCREDFLAVGGFDTDFTQANEDLDFGHRLTKAGRRIGFNPKAVSWQRYVVTPRQYLRQWRKGGQADVMFARKHPDEADRIFRSHLRERRSDRLVWRWLRVPLRWTVLGLAAAGADGARTTRWFYRVRNLEYSKGVSEAGGIPGPSPVRVLCYHAIADLAGVPRLDRYGVSPHQFHRQMALLERYYRFVGLNEVVRLVRGTGGVPRRAVLLTFDDCYADIAEDALPVLRERRIPAVAFAVTQRLGETNAWDDAGAQLRLLDADGLRRLAVDGVEIGSHTRTHPMLNRLAPGRLVDELQGSADDLVALGLARPKALAYPHGEYDLAVQGAASAAGYAAAFTVDGGLARSGHDPYAIPRIEILRADVGWRFLWKVAAVRVGSGWLRRRNQC